MNWVFFLLIFSAYATALWQHWQWKWVPGLDNPVALSPMQALGEQLLLSASEAVTLAIGLIGILALFMGLMNIIEESGLLKLMAKLLYPLLKWLFPDIPPNHPAFGAMTMNISANMLGLGNAATPFGLKTMQELEKLNPHPGVATNAMVLFLAINTSGLTLIPTKVIALRASAGSIDPAAILSSTLIATLCSTLVAILAAKLLQRWSPTPAPSIRLPQQDDLYPAIAHYPYWISGLALVALLLLIPLTLWGGKQFSALLLPSLVVAILAWGMIKKVDIYSSFTEGAKSGLQTAMKILPYLLAIMVAIGMFRQSGAMAWLSNQVNPITNWLGIPAEALPMVFMRPLSGTGSLGILSDILQNPALGPDSYTGLLVSTMMGSTETTCYILAVYFGAIQIRRIRHALAAGLIADLAAMMISVMAVNYIFF